MPKFFVTNDQIKDKSTIHIRGEDVNHIKNVLRKKVQDEIIIGNKENGVNYQCEIVQISEDEIFCKIKQEEASEKEPNINVTIFQGLPKAEKMEWIIQKSTELGATTIIPTIMKRCVVRVNEKDEKKKKERWQKIAEVAAKQCGRDKSPKIDNFINIKKLCENIAKYDIVIVAYEDENRNSMKTEVKNLNLLEKEKLEIGIVIGPEGGFEESEVKDLKENGAKIVTLGKRILRTETVALSMLSILMYELGDLN